MRRTLLALLALVGCAEEIPPVECVFDLPEAGARVPSAAGFNVRLLLTGTFTTEQIPLVRFYSEEEVANFPDGMLFESGIAIPEGGCAAGGCVAGDRIGSAEAPLQPGPHTIVAVVLTAQANEACTAEVQVDVNAPPAGSGLTFTPATPGTLDDVGYTVTGADDDGDTMSWSETWTGPSGRVVQGPLLPNVETAAGETWALSLRPRDEMDAGSPIEGSVTIANTAPAAPQVRVWPEEAGPNEPLRCAVLTLDGLDPDGVLGLTIAYSWSVDGNDVGIETDLVPASETEAGEFWTCTVTVSDGEGSSPPASADATIRHALDQPDQMDWTEGDLVRGIRTSMRLGLTGQVGSPGDLDGDGRAEIVLVNNDLALAAPTTSGGVAWILPSGLPLPTDVDDAAATIIAPDGMSIFAPSPLGDLNGDGLDDLVLPATEDGLSRVWIIFGVSGGWTGELNLEDIAVEIVGQGTPLGQVPCAVGDLDGDGAAELALAAPSQDGGTGTLYVVFGHPGAWVNGETLDHLLPAFRIEGASAGQELGSACAGPVDLDGNGLHDVVVGVPGGGPSARGRVLAFLSDGTRPSGSMSSASADLILDGEAGGPGGFGSAMAAIGDHDGDGAPDVAIWGAGPVGSTVTRGSLWLLPGGAAMPTGAANATDLPRRLDGGEAEIDDADQGLAFCGTPAGVDLDGDGLGDLACGDLLPDIAAALGGPVGVHIWFGGFGPFTSTGTWDDADLHIEADGGDAAGASVVGVMDRDGDGYGELLIGFPQDDTNAPDAGAVGLYRLPE